MRAVLLALCLTFLLVESSAATIYRWTGSDGRVHYGDQPPSGARNVQAVGAETGKATPPPAATAETDEASAKRDAECSAKRTLLNRYSKASKLMEKDGLGRERTYTDEERKLLIARTEAEIGVLCNPRAAGEATEPAFETGLDEAAADPEAAEPENP